jgi:hypothetical protein
LRWARASALAGNLRFAGGKPVARLRLVLQQPPDFRTILRTREPLELTGAC